MDVDFEAEGLLRGCSTEAERAARTQLLERLLDDGVPLEDLRQAVAENRLVLLPAERALTGEPRYTTREVADKAGVGLESLLREMQALGMPRPELDERVASEEDLAAARQLRRFREAGLPEEGLLEVARVVGQAMEQVAAASRQLVGPALLRPEDSELELARRYEAAGTELSPLVGRLLEHQYRVRMREGLRRAVDPRALESGELAGALKVSVAFADLVGFTRLGERLPASDLGRVAGRLAGMATDVAQGPVQLVKTIGDAAMLVSPETRPLIDAVLALLAAADAEGEEFPRLRAGAARGTALARGGDWYGSPVNLASRITAAARPGSILVSAEIRDDVVSDADGDGDAPYRVSRAPARRFKGVEGRVRLYRVRPAAADGQPG